MRVPAEQLEGAVLDRLRALGADPATVEALTAATNRRLARELPKLRKGREALSKQLPRLAAEADTVLTEWAAVPTGRAFVEDRLGTLSARRDDLHRGIADLDRQIAEIEAATASASTVCEAIRHIDEVYDCLRPHERKELFKLLLRSVEVGERQIVLEIYAGAAAHGAEAGVDAGALRIGRLGWLPGAVAHSVVTDRFRCTVNVPPRRRARILPGTVVSEPSQAEVWAGMLERGEVGNRAQLARRVGVSRARVTQVLGRQPDAREA